jgi:hypothetical protein
VIFPKIAELATTEEVLTSLEPTTAIFNQSAGATA